MSKYKGKSICIFSAKGGVGKTITTLNLAGVFASLEKKVLIIDLDNTSGAIATYLNKVPQKTIYDFVNDYSNKTYETINNYITKYIDNIDFISSCADPTEGNKIIPIYIELLLEKVLYNYDIVLIDTNHILNEFNITILDKVNLTLLVLTSDLIDLKNMRNLIQIFNKAGKNNYKVLLNYAINSNRNYYSLYDIKNAIKRNIDYIIDDSFNIKSIESYKNDSIILTMDNRMNKLLPKVYKAYKIICNDIMEYNNE